MKRVMNFWFLALTLVLATGCSDDNKVEPVAADIADGEAAGDISGAEGEEGESGSEGTIEKDTGSVGGCPPNSIGGIAGSDDQFSTLMTAVELVGLTDTLCNDGEFTVFAPTNDAFNALDEGVLAGLLEDTDALEAVILYHVVDGRVGSSEVVALPSIETKNGASITVELVDGEVVLNGSVRLVATDVEADNGMIHVIDGVLIPPTEGTESAEEGEATEAGEGSESVECSPTSLAGIAANNDDFSTLAAALDATELTEFFCTEGDFTVFAPTNAAFDALEEGVLASLLEDPEALADVLRYHVAAGKLMAADVVATDSIDTLLGQAIAVEVTDTGVILNGNVNVTTTDIEADNGVIHVIDGVLVPPASGEEEGGESIECDPNSIAGIATASEDFGTLVTALGVAGLVDTFCNPGDFTVFAPTDAAFEALPEGALDSLLEDVDALTNILTYHVLDGVFLAAQVIELDSVVALNGDEITIEVTNTGVVLNGSVNVTVTDIIASNGVIHVIDAVLLPPAGGEEGGEEGPEEGGEEGAEEGGEEGPEEGGEEGAEEGGEGGGCPGDSIAGIASASDDFTTLVAALSAAGLVDTFCQPGSYTVFAPTNAAFDKLPAGTVEALLQDIDQLTAILTYHVAGEVLLANDVVGLNEITTLNGAVISVAVTPAGVLLNGDVLITVTDILASNGVIHVIDGVLLPPSGGEEGGEGTEEGGEGTEEGGEATEEGGEGTEEGGEGTEEGGEGTEEGGEATEEGGEGGGCPADSISGIASATPELSTVVAALSAANLVETFCAPGDYTVFAPVNSAFSVFSPEALAELLADTETLTSILTYHVVGESLTSGEVVALDSITTLNGEDISVEVTGDGVVLNGNSLITVVDIQASNGIVHLIDAVLLPPGPVEPGLCAGACGGQSNVADCFCDELCDGFGDCCEGVCDDCTELDACQPEPECPGNSISGLATATDDLSTLVTALDTAGLVQTFCDPGDYTVFAPTNAAFAALSISIPDLLANGDLLASVLNNHVLAEALNGNAVAGVTSITPLSGVEFTVEVTGAGDIIINGNAKVVVADIEASNGIIHIIDAVIIESEEPAPGLCEGFCGGQSGLANCYCDDQCSFFGDCCDDVCTYCASLDACGGSPTNCSADSIGGLVEGLPEFSTLNVALETAELKETFCVEGDFTVFAPTNDAFDALPEGTLEAVLADQALLTSILTYHAASGVYTASEVVSLTEIPTLNGKPVSVTVENGTVFLNGNVQIISVDIAADNGVIHVIDTVLLPPEEPEPTCDPGSIVGVATAAGNFTTLLTALDVAGLTETFCDPGSFTVFAPTDDAFAALGDDLLGSVLADQELLTDILTYHVAAGELDAGQVVSSPFILMLNGLGVTVTVDGGVFLNDDVQVIATDIEASNGIIHAIGAVLLPPADNGTLQVGQECWAESLDCDSGLTCTLNATESSAACYPDLSAGAECGSGFGSCGSDSDCVQSGGSTSCLAKQAEGASCGNGIGLCVEGSSCVFDDATETSSTCQPHVGNGAFCGNYSQGGCKSGASCLSASPNPPFVFFCFTDEVVGDPCGPGKGLCLGDASCVFDDASETTSTCIATVGPGGACGSFGQGACQDNYSCSGGTCLETILAGGACGGGVGACLEGLSCNGGTCQ